MQVVNFSIRENVSPQNRERMLAEISGWPEVWKAQLLDASSPDPNVRRLGYVYVNAGHSSDALLNRLQALPGIESASEPARRGLA